jgi:hypothetical protein
MYKNGLYRLLMLLLLGVATASLQGHPAEFHQKVDGKILVGRIAGEGEGRVVLDKGSFDLGGEAKFSQVGRIAKPGDLEEFAFVEFVGGVLTELPPWFPREFKVGETSGAGVLRRSRQNPNLHFIQANRRLLRIPEDRDIEVWKHVELDKLPELETGRKVLLIVQETDGRKVAGAVCVYPAEEKRHANPQ